MKNIKKITRRNSFSLTLKVGLFFLMAFFQNTIHAQVYYEHTDASLVNSIEGSATWIQDGTGNFTYNNNGSIASQRAIVYSQNAYQSEDGFKLTIEYTSGSIDDDESHNFSFGLISDDTDLSTYSGFNPFRADTSVYSIGANLTTDEDTAARGLNFTNQAARINLDESGTRTQFATGTTTKVTIEIGIGGYWSYRINDVYENSGVLLEGFDLTKSYRVAVYGQDDNGGEKSIQSVTLEKRYAAGERALKLRGTWSSGIHVDLMDAVKDLKTLDGLGVSFTNGAVLSAQHKAPHKLFDMLPGGDAVAPAWGDLNSDTPEVDKTLDDMLKVKAAGLKVKAYTNSENFVGPNADELQPFVDSWIAYCDTDPEIQAFINSKPYHTGIWNSTTGTYEDASATYPMRKYMFCYAEYFLKDYALRYGKYIDNWIFDDGGTMEQNGDNATSGLIEEQRIYQAFTNAVHAGNPEISTAFNNGRSTTNYFATPFAHAVRFEDFTFGHAFGGNNDHGSKTGGQFNNNYRHVTRMTETNGNVFEGGDTWDDKIVGNFHSKVSTSAWKYGGTQAWEQDDFNQWNLEAMQAGGAMTWDGSFNRTETVVYGWVIVLLKGLDDYLAQNENPGPPNWARAYTILPEATSCEPYYHVLIEGEDFWDPENDDITELSIVSGGPSWLDINEDPENPGHWILSGVANESSATLHSFELQAVDTGGLIGIREVKLQVNEGYSTITDPENGTPVWKSETLDLDAFKHDTFSFTFKRCNDFEDFDGDNLTISIANGASWASLKEIAPNIWVLSGIPECAGVYPIELALTDGTNTTNAFVNLNVSDGQFIEMASNSIQNGYWNLPNEEDADPEFVYVNSGRNYDRRALLYSTESFQSDEGFKLKIKYNTSSIGDTGGHNFSFGLISTDTDLSTYAGFNPFREDLSVYSIGLNLTLDVDPDKRGLNFINGVSCVNLDESGTNVEFVTNASTEVILEITKNGAWGYSINGIKEASGVIQDGFDLTKSYKVGIYGQDDNGGKSIQEISLSTCFDGPTLEVEALTQSPSLNIYPNPVSTTFQILKQQGGQLQIFNMLGVLQLEETIQSDNYTINAERLGLGMYVVRVVKEDKTKVYKILKK